MLLPVHCSAGGGPWRSPQRPSAQPASRWLPRGTAGAAPNASLLIGSGSQTSYATMTSLSDLFNGAPGCDLTASTSLPLALNCGTSTTVAGDHRRRAGLRHLGREPVRRLHHPSTGRGLGQRRHPAHRRRCGKPDDDRLHHHFSRASAHRRATPRDNDVQYATDGVSWSTFSSVAGVKTAQAKVTNITLANLTAIWLGTLSCSVKGVTYNMDWICLGAKVSSPIDVYNAQTGSGTYSTWSSTLGYSGAAPAGITCAACEQGWVANGGASGTIVTAHENLFENQMATIAAQPDADAVLLLAGPVHDDLHLEDQVQGPGLLGHLRRGPGTDVTTLGGINGCRRHPGDRAGDGRRRRRDLPGHPWPLQPVQQQLGLRALEPGHPQLRG